MKPTTVDALLERYYAGETTLAEERQLAQYFAGADLAERHRPHKPLFAYWAEQQAVRSTQPAFRPPLRGSQRKRMLRLLAVAASLLLAVGLWFYQAHTAQDDLVATTEPVPAVDWSRYEVTDQREAIRILHRTLKPASGHLPITR